MVKKCFQRQEARALSGRKARVARSAVREPQHLRREYEVQGVATTTRRGGGPSRHAYFVKDRIGSINHYVRSSEPFEALHALFRGDQLPGYPRSSRVVTAPRQAVANTGGESP
jgi:hypothetical protein